MKNARIVILTMLFIAFAALPIFNAAAENARTNEISYGIEVLKEKTKLTIIEDRRKKGTEMDARLIGADEGDLFHRGNADDHRSAKVKIGQCLRHLQKHRAADTVVDAAAGEQIAVVHLDDRAVEHGDAADLDAHPRFIKK